MSTTTAKPAPQTLGAAAPPTNGKHAPEIRPIFEHYLLDDLDNLPPLEWLVANMLPVKGFGMIYGPPGNGKTFVVIDLACCLVKGNFLFAKEFGVHRAATVAYAAGEKFYGIPKRMRAAKKHWTLDPEARLRFHVYRGVPQLFDASLPASVLVFIEQLRADFPDGLDILFIDTMHAAMIGANENDSRDGGIAISNIKKIQDALGCAVILVHHANKGGLSERGTTAFRGAVDMVLKVEKSEGDNARIEVTCEKMSDADDSFTVCAKLTAVEGEDSRVLVWEGRGEKTKDLTEECIRILKGRYAQWLTARQVWEDVTLKDITERAVVTSLNRQAALGANKTGVHRQLQNESKKASRLNPNVFMYDRSGVSRDGELAPAYDPFEDS